MLQAWQRVTNSTDSLLDGPSAHEYPDLLGCLFVIEITSTGFAAFRIAGGNLDKVLDHKLVGTNFLDLWKESDRSLLAAFLECVAKGHNPGVIRAIGETDLGRHSEVELALAPLARSSAHHRRLLGLYQTLGGDAMMRHSKLKTHHVRSIELPYPDLKPVNLKLVASND